MADVKANQRAPNKNSMHLKGGDGDLLHRERKKNGG